MVTKSILKRQDGFTLIEIIAVLVLLGILAAVAVPKFLSLQTDAELKAVEGVKAELTSRANQYYAQYLLDNTKTTNGQNLAGWATEDMGKDFTLGRRNGQIQVTVVSSGNQYLIEWTRGINDTDGTGAPAIFGKVTAR
jgi:prepilin-type N-terminal cleavage/methylation domain-containing protein